MSAKHQDLSGGKSVGIYIPAYNAGKFLAATLDSVLAQTESPSKIVVVDNASEDSTPSVVQNYLKCGVEYHRHPRNIGSIANHNFCLDIASTDYVKLLSADDVLQPDVLRQQANALRNNPECVVATCQYQVVDENLHPIALIRNLPGKTTGARAAEICARHVANLIGNPSAVLLRRDAIGDHKFGDEGLKWYCDFRLMLSILKSGSLINTDTCGFYYRRHAGTDSQMGCPKEMRLADELSFVRQYSRNRIISHVRLLRRYRGLYIDALLGHIDRHSTVPS